jgi:hypothetical protein
MLIRVNITDGVATNNDATLGGNPHLPRLTVLSFCSEQDKVLLCTEGKLSMTPNGSARSLSLHHSPPCLLEPDPRKGAVCRFSAMQPFLVLIWFRQLQVKARDYFRPDFKAFLLDHARR